jgi:hypothetical protein
MKKIRDGAQDFALRALAGAGRAEEENGLVFHGAFRGGRELKVKGPGA